MSSRRWRQPGVLFHPDAVWRSANAEAPNATPAPEERAVRKVLFCPVEYLLTINRRKLLVDIWRHSTIRMSLEFAHKQVVNDKSRADDSSTRYRQGTRCRSSRCELGPHQDGRSQSLTLGEPSCATMPPIVTPNSTPRPAMLPSLFNHHATIVFSSPEGLSRPQAGDVDYYITTSPWFVAGSASCQDRPLSRSVISQSMRPSKPRPSAPTRRIWTARYLTLRLWLGSDMVGLGLQTTFLSPQPLKKRSDSDDTKIVHETSDPTEIHQHNGGLYDRAATCHGRLRPASTER